MDSVRQLKMGQRIPLRELTNALEMSVSVELVGVSPADWRPVLLCLDKEQKVIDGREVIHLGRKESSCKNIRLESSTPGEARFALRLAELSAQVERVVIAVGFPDRGGMTSLDSCSASEGSVVVRAAEEDVAIFPFRGADFDREKALCLVELYRKDGWRLAVVAGGFRGGLGSLLGNYRASTDLLAPIERGEEEASVQIGGAFSSVELLRDWPGGVEPAVPRDLLAAVGLVVVGLNDGGTATGTGFVISPGGLVLTCAHVVADAIKGGIVLGGSDRMRSVEFLAADLDNDVALLYMNDRAGSGRWLVLEEPDHMPSLGHPLGILGYPLAGDLGLDVSYCEGIVNSVRPKGNRALLQIDAGAAPGSSGAPVFSRATGRVVGILTSGLNLQSGGMHVNFAVDIRAVWRLGWFGGP